MLPAALVCHLYEAPLPLIVAAYPLIRRRNTQA
jgi:hypothetical protein